MKNKVNKQKFLGMEVRVVNEEWIVLKDMFAALGRVRENGDWSKEKKKLEKIIGKENIVSNKIRCKQRGYNVVQSVLCVKESTLNQYDIKSIFGRQGIIHTNLREEYSFIQNVENFFKYDKHISITKQVNIMQYKVDLVFGGEVCVFVEFDEEHHDKQILDDLYRMKAILLAHSYQLNTLHDTNIVENVTLKETVYEGFSVFEGSHGIFVRVRDKNCLSWIPLMYGYMDEYMDFLYHKFKSPDINHSDDLIKIKYAR